jgi:hypothetical protein
VAKCLLKASPLAEAGIDVQIEFKHWSKNILQKWSSRLVHLAVPFVLMTHARWFRIALGYLALSSLQIGIWALFAPRSFYDGFPGFGRTWVAVDGPYNEHLVRDFGALNLALLVIFVAAAVTLSRPLVMTAALASLVWNVPHFSYHLFNTDGLSSSDLVASLGGLLASVVFSLLILVTARTKLSPDGTVSAG